MNQLYFLLAIKKLIHNIILYFNLTDVQSYVSFCSEIIKKILITCVIFKVETMNMYKVIKYYCLITLAVKKINNF